jgi:ActR/RegA family two-component response regulator
MTGFASVDKAIYAFKQGAYDFIEKPFNYEALIMKINAAIQSKAMTTNRPVLIKMPHDRSPIANKKHDRLLDVVIDHPHKAALNNTVHQIDSRHHHGPDNISTSNRLLPMCSHCKKVRDEQGEWIQIEVFIEQHSRAKCSHSLCPECEGHLYPGMDVNPE